MNAQTAKAIKEIVAVFREQAYLIDCRTLTPEGEKQLEAALHKMAEGIKLDAIEP